MLALRCFLAFLSFTRENECIRDRDRVKGRWDDAWMADRENVL